MPFQPQDLAGGVARQDRVAQLTDSTFQSSQFPGDGLALFRGRGIAPQLGRADHLSRGIQWHKTMLLTAHANGFHLGGAGSGFLHCPLDALGHGGDPVGRVLLLRSGRQTAYQIIRFACRCQNFSGLGVYN